MMSQYSSPAPSAASVLQSDNPTFNTRITVAPFLARSPIRVIGSPGLNISLVQPRLCRALGLVNSPAHFTALPFSSVTSTYSWQWGLMNRNSTTFPLIVAGFDVSYAAAPWCANTGAEIISKPSATQKKLISLFVIPRLRAYLIGTNFWIRLPVVTSPVYRFP